MCENGKTDFVIKKDILKNLHFQDLCKILNANFNGWVGYKITIIAFLENGRQRQQWRQQPWWWWQWWGQQQQQFNS